MTDLLNREGVKTSTLEALTLPRNDSMDLKVRRFGFEYEMFPSGADPSAGETVETDDDGDAITIEERLDSIMAGFDSEDNDGCNCDECREARYNDEYREQRDALTRGKPGTGTRLIERAFAAGLIGDSAKHGYHCHCNTCAPTRTGALMTAQNDCSVGIEFVSRIIDLANWPGERTEISEWVELMEGWKADGGWMPDGVTSCGNHVHVSKHGDSPTHSAFTDAQMGSARQHIIALYAVFDWDRVADGGCGQLRGYNPKPTATNIDGGWLSDRGYGTFEHRVWNTPRDPRRLWGHLGLSLALTRWAFALAEAMPDFSFWERTYDNYWRNYTQRMTDETHGLVRNNLREVTKAVSAYIPEHDEFDIARELITLLRQ